MSPRPLCCWNVVSARVQLSSGGTMEKDRHGRTLRGDQRRSRRVWRPWRCSSPLRAAKASRRDRSPLARPRWPTRRTALYNGLVVGYHKAKIERADMARELEAAKDMPSPRGPSSEEDLPSRPRAALGGRGGPGRSCQAGDERGVGAARWAGSNHITELEAAKQAGREEVEDLSRRLEEVEKQRRALRDEVTAQSQELTETAKRWVSEISVLDRGLAAAFPEAQDAALAAVGKAREERRQATGEQSSAFFSMDDYLASMAARVEPITKLGWELRKAAEELIRLLWPTETLPQDLANLIKWLETAPTASSTGRTRPRAGRHGVFCAVLVQRASEALLVYGRSRRGQQPGFFDQVDSIFTSFFSFSFCIQLDPWRVDVSRQDGFGPVYEEEWCEAD
ncbi:hypothetical protein QYE76_032786 [Lolium multiflorum]|uniref:Uncharacterized protein n=1 Tax=Lolium multiflorum TaxID=4521 RepID=A0AAD8QUA4_LOLMU|nr:hypothetical protein QYE76_032786 [Lolium multiflorum]